MSALTSGSVDLDSISESSSDYKVKVYEDLTSAEGTLQFAGDIKRTLNSILPESKGEPLIVQALFESFVLQ